MYFTLQLGGAYVDGDPKKSIKVIYPQLPGPGCGHARQLLELRPESGAYGATPAGSGIASPFAYAGAEFNSTDQLVYLRNRFYSPQLQRFISEDPIGINGGVNTFVLIAYEYVPENEGSILTHRFAAN